MFNFSKNDLNGIINQIFTHEDQIYDKYTKNAKMPKCLNAKNDTKLSYSVKNGDILAKMPFVNEFGLLLNQILSSYSNQFIVPISKQMSKFIE